jgi:hypothetical protein
MKLFDILHDILIVNIVNNFGRGTSKLQELVPNPFDYINKICSKQTKLVSSS